MNLDLIVFSLKLWEIAILADLKTKTKLFKKTFSNPKTQEIAYS